MKYLIEVLGDFYSVKNTDDKTYPHSEPTKAKFVYTLVDEKSVALSVIQCPILDEIPEHSVVRISKI